jgi:DNA-binding transcriptional LysR family regulator
MQTFVRVGRHLSFAATARELRTTAATVSRRVSDLESALGVQLLHRTTRQVRLTAEGDEYLRGAEAVLDRLRRLDEGIAARQSGPSGRLRIGCGVSVGQAFLLDAVAEFSRAHPRVDVELVLEDRHVNLVERGLDATVRIGQLRDSSMKMSKLGVATHVACASPDYLASLPALPAHPDDLLDADLIVDTNQPRAWSFRAKDGKEVVEVIPRGRLVVNNAHCARQAALAGLGIAQIPTFVVGEDLRRRELLPVLEGYALPAPPISLIHPGRRSKKLQLFQRLLEARLQPVPPWEQWRAPRVA